MWLAGEENSSIFAPACETQRGLRSRAGSSLHIGIRCFFKAIKLKKIKVKKNLFFYLPESKEGVYLQPQKQRRFLIKTVVVLEFF